MRSNASKASKAVRTLFRVTARQVEAMDTWHAADPEAFRAVLDLIGATCDARRDDPEVAALAGVTVASFREGARSDAHAAMAAVAHARRVVGRAHSLTAWAGDTGAVLDLAGAGDPDAVGTLARYAPAPDAMARWTPGDAVETLTATRPRLRQACATWREHEHARHAAREAGTAASCGCEDGLAHRVTLRGVEAHVTGVTRTDSGYWRFYSGTDRAARDAAEEFRAHGLAGDPDPFGEAHPRSPRTTGGDRTPVTTERPEGYGQVTVTRADGRTVTRDLTPRERLTLTGARTLGPVCQGDGCEHDSCHGIRAQWLTRAARRPDHGGEWGKVTTAPASWRDRTPTGQVRAFPTVVSPRKRARTGSTGPTTNAW